MLKLKKIHILGFKSFCDRTELTVSGTGIAVVVGPNGCGKSNISGRGELGAGRAERQSHCAAPTCRMSSLPARATASRWAWPR